MAYSANLVWTGLAATAGYATGELVPVKGQLAVILVFAVLTSVSNFILEFFYLRESSFSCCEKQHPSKLSATNCQFEVSTETEPTSFNGDSNEPTVNVLHFSLDTLCTNRNPDQGLSADNPLFKICSELESKNTMSLKSAPSLVDFNNGTPGEFSNMLEPFANHSPPQIPTSHFPNLTLLDREDSNGAMYYEDSKSNLVISIKYSQSYMDALDNNVLYV